jgi:hypothetical protein
MIAGLRVASSTARSSGATGGVGAEEIHGALECVGDFLAEEFREPGLFVEFDELNAAHAGLAGEEYEALVRGAAHGLVGMRGSCREM